MPVQTSSGMRGQGMNPLRITRYVAISAAALLIFAAFSLSRAPNQPEVAKGEPGRVPAAQEQEPPSTRASIVGNPNAVDRGPAEQSSARTAASSTSSDVVSAYRNSFAIARRAYLRQDPPEATEQCEGGGEVSPSAAFEYSVDLIGGQDCKGNATTLATFGVLTIHKAVVAPVGGGAAHRRCYCSASAGPDRLAADGSLSADASLESFFRTTFGSEWFEATVVSASLGVQPVLFTYRPTTCSYVSHAFLLSNGHVMPSSKAGESMPMGPAGTVDVMVKHLHSNYNAVREAKEGAHYNYIMKDIPPSEATAAAIGAKAVPNSDSAFRRWQVGSVSSGDTNSMEDGCQLGTPLLPGPYWRAVRADSSDVRKSGLGGYWLSYKTIDNERYKNVPNLKLDYLGRLNFGGAYALDNTELLVDERKKCCEGASKKLTDAERRQQLKSRNSPAAAKMDAAMLPIPRPCGRDCFLEKLRGRTIYFFGDSHMRILFYGFLSRMGITFPMNSVWRGDRTDKIDSHKVTIKFVASYFLNMSRPSAVDMLNDKSRPIIVLGVGQHHSCHCWSLKKHMEIVTESLDAALKGPPRDLVWFGVPAQPYNTHLYRPKPVGQSRKDCRNNARHLLFSGAQRELVTRRGVKFLDAFAMSLGLQHTSLDGAHYYTHARDAWIDSLASLI